MPNSTTNATSASAVEMPGALTFPADGLRALAKQFLIRVGTPEDIARVVADDLIDANLVGHDSHGILRLGQYLNQIDSGALKPAARPKVVKDHAATALVSGEWGFGQVSGRYALDLAVERAKTFGVGAVGLIRANHVGRLGAFMERATAKGCVALMWVGGIGGNIQAVPFGGAQPMYGTNPFAAGVPAGEHGEVVVDFATTQIAAGKIHVALDEGKQLPPGSIVDKEGTPITDPATLLREGGALLPFGGHKGYGLAVLVELLGKSLTGADTTGDEDGGGIAFKESGAMIVAIDAGAFRPAEDAVASAAKIVAKIRSSPPAPGFERVMTPGEPESRTRAQRRVTGITLHPTTWQAVMAAGERIGIASETTERWARGEDVPL